MSADVRHEHLTIAGTRLHLQSAGDGPPLLYLHGANGVAWLPGHDLLAERCRVLLPEHPGWAEDELAGGLEGIDDLVYFYLDVLDALGLERVHLVGHSLGGWLAAELAVTQPHRFWTTTLVDAAGLWLADTPMPDLFALSPAESARLWFCTTAGGFSQHVIAITDDVRRRGIEVLEIVDRAVELGTFPAAPAEKACAMCDVRRACGPNEERRTRWKSRDLLGDLSALREMK